jgi:N-acetylmuramoyl-L-alanine amidase
MFWDYIRKENKDRLSRLNLPSTAGKVKMLIFDKYTPYTLDILPDMKIYDVGTKTGIHGTWCGQVARLVYPELELHGCGYTSKIEEVIDYAIKNNIKIISASINFSKSDAKETALKKFHDWGGIFVTAAGNDGGRSILYPGSSRFTICVSATNTEDCDGPEIDVTADSYWFVRNKNPGYYHSFNGTSASTPVIAGCVAHIIARYPEWDCEDVRAYLHENSTTEMESLEEFERLFSFPDDFGKEGEPQLNNPEFIIIHHSATIQGDVATFDRNHKARGFRKVGYHYVINNGTYKADGLVEVGRTEYEDGAHCKPDGMNFKSIGICLVGDFDKTKPTPAQMASLEKLVKDIMARHKIPPFKILGHGEVAATNCPGKNFDMTAFRKRLEEKKVEKKDYEGHWAKASIEKAKESGIMAGYPDGTFKPDQLVTRAELATVVAKLLERQG